MYRSVIKGRNGECFRVPKAHQVMWERQVDQARKVSQARQDRRDLSVNLGQLERWERWASQGSRATLASVGSALSTAPWMEAYSLRTALGVEYRYWHESNGLMNKCKASASLSDICPF